MVNSDSKSSSDGGASVRSNAGALSTTIGGRIELKIMSDPANLAAARAAVERLVASSGFDAAAVGEIGLVVNEALANVIRHAYRGRTDQPIRIVAESDEQGVTIKIRDWGTGENPVAKVKHLKRDPLKPGGLGLVCIHEMMDQTTFTPQADGMLLTMKRGRMRQA
jgi:serine/threonine-protein kinase RsbW